jgi:hypothetical protein
MSRIGVEGMINWVQPYKRVTDGMKDVLVADAHECRILFDAVPYFGGSITYKLTSESKHGGSCDLTAAPEIVDEFEQLLTNEGFKRSE